MCCVLISQSGRYIFSYCPPFSVNLYEPYIVVTPLFYFYKITS
nr:MAG TPA: hypothetical protein [Caudoviricetes sp.]